MYRIVATDGRQRAHMETVHGVIEATCFYECGHSLQRIKGVVATTDLKEIGTQVELSNTYHLHVLRRPGL